MPAEPVLLDRLVRSSEFDSGTDDPEFTAPYWNIWLVVYVESLVGVEPDSSLIVTARVVVVELLKPEIVTR